MGGRLTSGSHTLGFRENFFAVNPKDETLICFILFFDYPSIVEGFDAE